MIIIVVLIAKILMTISLVNFVPSKLFLGCHFGFNNFFTWSILHWGCTFFLQARFEYTVSEN